MNQDCPLHRLPTWRDLGAQTCRVPRPQGLAVQPGLIPPLEAA